MHSPRSVAAMVHLMYFASGAASLVLQVVWFKQIQFVLGSSTFSVSVTVASFFFGLSVGSLFGGRVADRVKRPLLLYAALEAGLGLLAVVLTAGLARWESWAPLLADWLQPGSATRVPLTATIAFLSLLPATILMGATLPLLARWIVERRDALAQRVGHLYAINTLGAAVGCAAVGFYGIGALGVSGSAHFAALLYLAIGATAFTLSGGASHRRAPEPDLTTGVVVERPGLIAAVFAISGFLAIAYEVIWFRLLTNYGGQSVFAFSGMLSVYLLGLVGGSLICARRLAHHKESLLSYFALTQALIAFSALLSVAVLGRGRNILALAAALPFPRSLSLWLGESPEFFVLCAVAVLPPTLILGVAFPLAAELTVHELGTLSKRLGALYAANTLGGVLGSAVAGFVLLPLLGSWASMVLLACGNLALAAIVIASQARLRQDRELLRQAALCGVLVVGGFGVLGPGWIRDALSLLDGAEIKEFAETRDATFIVANYPGKDPYQQLVVNGKSYANNRPEGRRYMAALAHLPVLVHPAPESALVICIGTGTTVGSLTTHPGLARITAVDLSATVFDFAPHFVPKNHSFFENPRVDKVVADGRNFLLTTDQSWDVMTFEPPPPHDAGVVNLYSEEFYRVARSHMNEGGVLAQWVPMDIGRGDLVWSIVRAMQSSFPHVSLWVSNRMEGIAIGSDRPLQIDVPRLEARMRQPDVAADLAAVGLEKTEHLLGTFVAADDALRRLAGEGAGITDDHPTLEYHNLSPVRPIRYAQVIAGREGVEKYLTGNYDEAALERGRRTVTAIWLEHEAGVDGNQSARVARIAEAEALEPGNGYVAFLREESTRAGAGGVQR